MVTSVRRTLTKTGQQILIAQIEDTTGSCDVVVFSKIYPSVQHLFNADQILVVKGTVAFARAAGRDAGRRTARGAFDRRKRGHGFRAAGARVRGARGARMARRRDVARSDRPACAAVVDEWPGDVPIVMHARGRSQLLNRTVSSDVRLRGEFERIFGRGNVREGAPDLV